jgi:neutral ceramidase
VSLRLGDLVIVGVPGEMAASLGLQIKAEIGRVTGVPYPAIGGLADVWASYILPADEYERGGYEASMSFYGAKLGETIVAGVIEGAKKLQGEVAAADARAKAEATP